MNRWFRVYSSLIDDPKFIKLSPELKSALLMVWCVASGNNGRLPALDDIAIKFRMSEEKTSKLLNELRKRGFIDDDEHGSAPHNWDVRQYKSDITDPTNAERQKRFRERKRYATVTEPLRDRYAAVTDKRPDTDTESDTEQNARAVPALKVVATSAAPDKLFFDQAVVYLGASGRGLAAKLLKAKSGNVQAAHAALLTAAQKSEPREYIGRIIAGKDDGDRFDNF